MNVSPGCISAMNDGLVGLAAGIRLHVGEAAVEQLAGALDRQAFGDVDELAAAVIAPAGIAFRVFVGHHRALRLEHGARHDVFRGDEFDPVALTAEFEFDRAGDLRIGVGEAGGKERVRTDRESSSDVHRQTFHKTRLGQEGERRGHSMGGSRAKGKARLAPLGRCCTRC